MDTLVIGLFVAALAWMLWRAWHKAQRYRRLAMRGVPVEAEVLRRFERRRPKSPRIPYIEYRFTTLTGESLTQSAVIPRAAYARILPGDSLAVIYDPDVPSFSRPRVFLERKGYLDPQ